MVFLLICYMKRLYRCGPLMHRVDVDQRIDGDPLGFRARGAKMSLYEIVHGGGGLDRRWGGLDRYTPTYSLQYLECSISSPGLIRGKSVQDLIGRFRHRHPAHRFRN